MYEDRQTDMTKIMGAFQNYAKALKNKFALLLIKTTS
jgi:hypothetical protein